VSNLVCGRTVLDDSLEHFSVCFPNECDRASQRSAAFKIKEKRVNSTVLYCQLLPFVQRDEDIAQAGQAYHNL
jgi:hypothetical protein